MCRLTINLLMEQLKGALEVRWIVVPVMLVKEFGSLHL